MTLPSGHARRYSSCHYSPLAVRHGSCPSSSDSGPDWQRLVLARWAAISAQRPWPRPGRMFTFAVTAPGRGCLGAASQAADMAGQRRGETFAFRGENSGTQVT